MKRDWLDVGYIGDPDHIQEIEPPRSTWQRADIVRGVVIYLAGCVTIVAIGWIIGRVFG